MSTFSGVPSSDPMRVLLISDLFPPHIGGLEQHVQNLSRGLAARGHSVGVATMWSEDLPMTETLNGVRVHRIKGTAMRAGSHTNPSGRPYASPIPDPEVVLALARIVARERPQIVHGHNWMVHSYLPLKAASRARLVVTLHDYGVICAKRSLMYGDSACSGPAFTKCLRCAAATYGAMKGLSIATANWMINPALRSGVDIFLPVSTAVAEGNRLGTSGLRYEVVPNFVPDDVESRADPTHETLARLPKGPFVLFVGALLRHKGIEVLLDAYGGLSAPPPLVIIGTRWPETPATFPPGTIVLENLPHPGVMAAWRRAAIGTVPSVFPDPCPTVAMEAMACGVPLVGSRIGGLPDLIDDGQTGLLFEAGSSAALGAALSKLIADPAEAARMGQAARRKVTSFTASRVIDRLEEIYSRLRAAAI